MVRSVAGKFFQWFILQLIAILPLGINAIVMHDHNRLKCLADVWDNGELFLISVITTATAGLDILTSKAPHYKRRTGLGLGAFGIALLSVLWYAEMASGGAETTSTGQVPIHHVVAYSPWLYLCAVGVSLACALLSSSPDGA